MELPELFTVTSAEYEDIHSAWYKAVEVLPDYSIVHKQDFFIKENYQPDTCLLYTSNLFPVAELDFHSSVFQKFVPQRCQDPVSCLEVIKRHRFGVVCIHLILYR